MILLQIGQGLARKGSRGPIPICFAGPGGLGRPLFPRGHEQHLTQEELAARAELDLALRGRDRTRQRECAGAIGDRFDPGDLIRPSKK
ncbi:hypothetical protein D3227_28470 [Mesorhizobium waimense]|uniref:Uncharacterized protein n=1 Tax=Mesorhizobium waimense TaxID=1300307 RepID=A0A3A5KGA3_9HYPH|nr:hypothetical protein D3227_28470 [Mesorhizobium waimense]